MAAGADRKKIRQNATAGMGNSDAKWQFVLPILRGTSELSKNSSHEAGGSATCRFEGVPIVGSVFSANHHMKMAEIALP